MEVTSLHPAFAAPFSERAERAHALSLLFKPYCLTSPEGAESAAAKRKRAPTEKKHVLRGSGEQAENELEENTSLAGRPDGGSCGSGCV